MTTTTATLMSINIKWVYLCFCVSVLLISTLAVSSASARRLVPSETQQTTHNPDKYSFDFHEEPSGSGSGREEGPYESDNSDTFGISTKVPRSADYGNTDGILSNPAEPDNADHVVPKNADHVDIGEFPSVSEHNNADYVNMDEFPSVLNPKNLDHVVPKNADYVDMDGIPSISSPRYESDIDGDIYGINSSIYIPRPVTDEPDHEEQLESKDSANAIKPAGSSDSANAMEAAAGVPIH